MSGKLSAEGVKGNVAAIDGTSIRDRIVRNAGTVADWAMARLVRDSSGVTCISELYSSYESYCRRENLPPLPRKTWIATMKLAGFQTESGAFKGVAVRV